MLYQPPFGSSDPNAPYVDRSTSGATRGSIPPAAAIEDPQREIVDVISKSGQTPADSLQLSKVIRSQAMNYFTAGGTANALTITPNPAFAALADLVGVPLRVRTGGSANTGAATLAVSGLAATSILRADGSALRSGDLPPDTILDIIYSGTAFRLLRAGGGVFAPSSGRVLYSTAGTFSFVPPAGCYLIYVEACVGGGGGGGGASATSSDTAASGGGAGGNAQGFVLVTPGVGVAIIVGSGGSGGTANGLTPGGNGGVTSVGGVLIGNGGSGSPGSVNSYNAVGASPGTASGGQTNWQGSGGDGSFAVPNAPIGGPGGFAFGFSTSGRGNQDSVGSAGFAPGSGGNGAASAAGGGNKAGGAGAAGCVIINY